MNRFIFFLLAILILPIGMAALDDAEAYYSFDDNETSGTTAEDISGNNNDGTLNGGVTTGVTGILNEAYSFDGTDDYISTPGLSNPSKLTFSTWIKTGQTEPDQGIILAFQEQGVNGDAIQLLQIGDIVQFGVFNDGASSYQTVDATTDITDGVWHHVVAVYDDTTGDAEIYVDGVSENTDTFTNNGALFTDSFSIGVQDRLSKKRFFNGEIDDAGVWSRALSSSEVSDLYNSGNARNPYGQTNFTVSAVDAFDNTTISNFSANLTGNTSGTTYVLNTTTGTITTPILANSTELWNINVASSGYQTEIFTGYNVSTGLVAELNQAQSRFVSAKTKVTDQSLTDFNVSINSQTFKSNTTFASPTSYNATFSKDGWYNKTEEYNQSTLNQSFTDVYDQKIKITADELIDGSTVQNFSGRITGPNNFQESFNTTNSTAFVEVETNEEYNVIIDSAPGFATIFNNGSLIMNDTFTTNNNATYNAEFETYTYNTVGFNVFDVGQNELVNEQVNLTIINGPQDRTQTSLNGTILVQDLLTGSYTARVETATYATQDVFFTVKNSSYQEIDLYLDDTTTTVFFTVRDTLRDPVDDATVTMNTDINGSTVLIGQKSTDFSGTASFQLNPSRTYTFTVVASGFSTFEGTLTPTLTEYTVTLSKVGEGVYVNPNQDFGYRTNISVVNGTWTWTWKTTSSNNAINTQNYSFVYDGVTYQDSSTSSSGTVFTENGTVVQGNPKINVSYEVNTVNGVETFTEVFSLINQFPVFEGFRNIEGESGMVVQAFIATLVTSVLVVAVTIGAGITPGVYTGAISLGFFGFFGFLPVSVTLISIASLITIGLSLGRVRI